MKRLMVGFALVVASSLSAQELRDRTLVSWAAVDDLSVVGGSVLTVENGDRFDALVYGELAKGRFMLGSDRYSRSVRAQQDWPQEKTSGAFVQVAATYADKSRTVTLYRDGAAYASYQIDEKNRFVVDTEALNVLFGRRHSSSAQERSSFVGRISDARIYDRVLTAAEIAALRPGDEGAVAPFAWWDFATRGGYERTGRFPFGNFVGTAAVRDGALVLTKPGDAFVTSVSSGVSCWDGTGNVPVAVNAQARLLRERIIEDPHRPLYHFAAIDGFAMPGDPNGCFFAKGRYHLMYLYRRDKTRLTKGTERNFSWGHLVSADLLHWRHLPDAIGPEGGDNGAYSGGGFLDDDGTAYLSYWMLWGARGLGLVRSTDADYAHWERHPANPVIKATRFGEGVITLADGTTKPGANADPSNIWKKDGRYYMLAGNKPILNRYGRKADSPQEYRGDRLDLYVSDDLADWKFVKVFYQRRVGETRATGWTDEDEDNMCPQFLPLYDAPANGKDSGKWLLTFISHNRGCQYYIGTYDKAKDEFVPESHGRMSWVDNSYFAPEAMIDGQNRHLLWAWLTGEAQNQKMTGWSGVYALPRVLWLRSDGTLGIDVPAEFEKLRLGGVAEENVTVAEGGVREVKGDFPGDRCEIQLTVPYASAGNALVRVRATADGREETSVWYDAAKHELVVDNTKNTYGGKLAVERAPFALAEGEALQLRLFVDRSVLDVFANERQAVSRRICPKDAAGAKGVYLSAQKGTATYSSVRVWEMDATNPY